jgi:NAD-dependent dihydropyrimidine dehydrogenase PreA subunit
MGYVIASTCIDVKDGACQETCPVECMYEGGRMTYIQPDECIDCGLCLSVCPVDAIYASEDLPESARIRARQRRVLWTGDHRLGLARRRRLGPCQRSTIR